MSFTQGNLTLIVDSAGDVRSQPDCTPIAYIVTGAGSPEGFWKNMGPIWELHPRVGPPIAVPSNALKRVFPLGPASQDLAGKVCFSEQGLNGLRPLQKTMILAACGATATLVIYITVRDASELLKVTLNSIVIENISELLE